MLAIPQEQGINKNASTTLASTALMPPLSSGTYALVSGKSPNTPKQKFQFLLHFSGEKNKPSVQLQTT